jgi:hypothetical protein
LLREFWPEPGSTTELSDTAVASRQIFLGRIDEAFSAQFLYRNAFSRSQRMIGWQSTLPAATSE